MLVARYRSHRRRQSPIGMRRISIPDAELVSMPSLYWGKTISAGAREHVGNPDRFSAKSQGGLSEVRDDSKIVNSIQRDIASPIF